MINKSQKLYITFLFLIISLINNDRLYSENLILNKNHIGFEIGTNYWGFTKSLLYEYQFNTSLKFKFMVSSGSFYIDAKKNDFLAKNIPGTENDVNIDIKQIFDFTIFFKIRKDKNIIFLNEVGIGFSKVYIFYKQLFREEYTNDIYKGEKDYSFNGILLSINVLKFKPNKSSKFGLNFGIKSHIYYSKSPQKLLFTNEENSTQEHDLFNITDKNYLIFAYPEIFFNCIYKI